MAFPAYPACPSRSPLFPDTPRCEGFLSFPDLAVHSVAYRVREGGLLPRIPNLPLDAFCGYKLNWLIVLFSWSLDTATSNAFGTWSYRSCAINPGVRCAVITSITMTCLTVFSVVDIQKALSVFQ